MKRKVIALCVLLALTVSSLTGCGNTPQNANNTVNQANVAVVTQAVTEATTVPQTTKAITLEDVADSFIGWALDDVSRAFSEAKKANLFSYESDNGKKIIVKNNWSVDSYRIEDNKIVFICTKFRSDGIIDAAVENADGIATAAEIIKMLS